MTSPGYELVELILPIKGGRLPNDIREWLESRLDRMAESRSDLVGSGYDWYAYTKRPCWNGDIKVDFYFTDINIAVMFKLTWG